MTVAERETVDVSPEVLDAYTLYDSDSTSGDFPSVVQSLDPGRPVEHLAFENLHDREHTLCDLPLLDHFVNVLLRQRSRRSYAPTYISEAVGLARTIFLYGQELLDDIPDDPEASYTRAEIERRVKMWFEAIDTHVNVLSAGRLCIRSELDEMSNGSYSNLVAI